MSKRPYPDQSTVSTIKIRKLENDNYQIDNRSTSDDNVKTEPEDDYNASYSHDMYNSASEQSYMNYDPLAIDYNSSQSSYNPLPDTNDGELVCTPSFDAFDSIIQSQEDEDDSNEPFLNLPLEIKIESVTSLANSSYGPTRSTAQPEIQDANGYIDSIYETENGDNSQSTQVTKPGKKRRAIRHLVYIFADDGNRYFPCHCCTSAFIKKYLLIKHIVTKHKDIIVCKLCACIFTQQMQNSYQQHMKAHNMRLPTQTKQCPLCLFWLTPKCYQGHLSSHNLLQKHICRQCRQEFPSFYVRAKHVCPMRIY